MWRRHANPFRATKKTTTLIPSRLKVPSASLGIKSCAVTRAVWHLESRVKVLIESNTRRIAFCSAKVARGLSWSFHSRRISRNVKVDDAESGWFEFENAWRLATVIYTYVPFFFPPFGFNRLQQDSVPLQKRVRVRKLLLSTSRLRSGGISAIVNSGINTRRKRCEVGCEPSPGRRGAGGARNDLNNRRDSSSLPWSLSSSNVDKLPRATHDLRFRSLRKEEGRRKGKKRWNLSIYIFG